MARFDSLRYHVHKLSPDEKVDTVCARLFKFPEFQKLRTLPYYNRLVAYICYLYDQNTELAQEYKDLQARKDAAAIEARFERVLTGGKKSEKPAEWPKYLQEIMDMRNKDVHAAIMVFLRDQNNHVYTEIVVTEQELDEFQALRMQSMIKKKQGDKDVMDAANKKSKLMEECSSRIKYLTGLKKQFYEDHTDVQKAEFSEAITPENAERIITEKPWEEVESEEELNVNTDVPTN